MPITEWNDKNFTIHVDLTVRKNISKGLALVKAAARARCPVGIELRGVYRKGKDAGKAWTARVPGTLKKSIRSRMSKKKLSGQVIAGARSGSDLTGFYASMIERGTSHNPAQSFMRSSLESTFEAVMAGFENTLK